MLEDFIRSDKEKIINYIKVKWTNYRPFADDIFNDLIIMFFEMPKEKRIDIIGNNKINHWFIHTINNTLSSAGKGKLYRKYIMAVKIEFIDDIEEEIDEEFIKKVEKYVADKLTDWQKCLWKDYKEGMKLKEIAKKYGISYVWCCLKLKEIRETLKKL